MSTTHNTKHCQVGDRPNMPKYIYIHGIYIHNTKHFQVGDRPNMTKYIYIYIHGIHIYMAYSKMSSGRLVQT